MLNEPLTVNEFKYPECIKLCSNSVWMHCPVCLFCVSLPLSNPYVCARVTRYVQCFCGFTPSLFCRVGCSCPFLNSCVSRQLAETFLSFWTDWWCGGPAGHQLSGSTLLHTTEFKGQRGLTATITPSVHCHWMLTSMFWLRFDCYASIKAKFVLV